MKNPSSASGAHGKPCWSFMKMTYLQADILKLSFTCGKTTETVRSI